jgi:hypothetical protein
VVNQWKEGCASNFGSPDLPRDDPSTEVGHTDNRDMTRKHSAECSDVLITCVGIAHVFIADAKDSDSVIFACINIAETVAGPDYPPERAVLAPGPRLPPAVAGCLPAAAGPSLGVVLGLPVEESPSPPPVAAGGYPAPVCLFCKGSGPRRVE